ncbi:MAG: hypothetical protein ABI743_14635, partial [bacterium]
DRLATRIGELDGQVVELDEEFKDNQIQATKLRKDIRREEHTLKLLIYIASAQRDKEIFDQIVDELPESDPLKRQVKLESLEPKIARLKNALADLQNRLKDVRKVAEQGEYKLRKTAAKIEEIQKHPMSKPVTGRIEKQRRLDQQERESRGIKERSMEERLKEIETIHVPSAADYLHAVLDETEQEIGGTLHAAPAKSAEPATAGAAADTGGSGLDLSF